MSLTSFSSAVKYSSVTYKDGAYVLGAPEFVLREDYSEYQEIIEEKSSKGYRVLVFGKYAGTPTGKELTEKVIPLCLILLSNRSVRTHRRLFDSSPSRRRH